MYNPGSGEMLAPSDWSVAAEAFYRVLLATYKSCSVKMFLKIWFPYGLVEHPTLTFRSFSE